MPRPNQSANWDFRFNRRSPSQKKKKEEEEEEENLKTRVSHKNSNSSMTPGDIETKKNTYKMCHR